MGRTLFKKLVICFHSSRYFFDNIEKKCVRFGGCTDVGQEENNFESRQECAHVCFVSNAVTVLTTSSPESAQYSDDSPQSSSSAASVVVYVLLAFTIIG